MKLPIYMDYHATTPVDPRVLEAMLPYFRETFGNASSRQHKFGWDAAAGVENARRQVARLINARPEEIIFTSGATESDNLAIKGAALRYRDRGHHLVSLPTEHKAVIDSLRSLQPAGFEATLVPVRPDGLVDLDRLKDSLRDKTILVSIMGANNEIGTLQPLAEIGKLCHERGILFHTDAAQAAGKIPIDVDAMHVDLLSLSGHKTYGPKGVGALYVRGHDPKVDLASLLDGGGQEHGWRSGTLNVPGIVGVGKACEIARDDMPEESKRLATLRDRLKDALLAHLEGVHINGTLERRLPHNLSVSFEGVELDALLTSLNDVALSSGSACASGNPEPSYVLRALGLRDDLAHSVVRFGLGRLTTTEEVDYVADRVVESVKSLRELSSLSPAQSSAARKA